MLYNNSFAVIKSQIWTGCVLRKWNAYHSHSGRRGLDKITAHDIAKKSTSSRKASTKLKMSRARDWTIFWRLICIAYDSHFKTQPRITFRSSGCSLTRSGSLLGLLFRNVCTVLHCVQRECIKEKKKTLSLRCQKLKLEMSVTVVSIILYSWLPVKLVTHIFPLTHLTLFCQKQAMYSKRKSE